MLALGYRKQDMFTDRLTTPAMIAITWGSHPGTAVHHALSGGLSTTDHLLATLNEQQAGLVTLTKRFPRPGVTDTDPRPASPPVMNDPDAPVQHIAPDPMTIEQFEARLRAHTGG